MNKKFIGFIFTFGLIITGFFSHTVYAVDLVPSITGFDPNFAKVDHTIVINGQNFTNVKKVFFGAIDATGFYHIDSPTKISVVVPKGAITDKVTLVTDKSSVDSPTNFIVINKSDISITISTIEPTSVTFQASGTFAEDSYTFSIYDIQNSKTSPVLVSSKEVDTTMAFDHKMIETTFNELKPDNTYMATIKAGEISFSINSFKTHKVNLNTSALNGMILEANNAYDKAVEGYADGEYTQGSKILLSEAIQKAEYIVAGIDNYVQSDVDNATRDLKTTLNDFELRKISPVATTTTVEDPAITDIKNNGIVPKCNIGGREAIDEKTGQYKVPCDFTFFMKLINNAIKFLLFVIATPLIALIIMYTGYLYLTAGGNAGQVEKVKHILLNAVVGYIIALTAWLIVNTIVTNIKLDPTINTFLGSVDK